MPKDLQTTFTRKLVALMKNDHLSTKLAVKNISNERSSDKKGKNEILHWELEILFPSVDAVICYTHTKLGKQKKSILNSYALKNNNKTNFRVIASVKV